MVFLIHTGGSALMIIIQRPVLRDNYMYLVHDEATGMTAAIDPPEASTVLRVLNERGWKLTHILNTHHHADHTGGNLPLKEANGCVVHGLSSTREFIPGLDMTVSEGDDIEFGDERVRVMSVPGHTQNHLAYFFPQARALFCGDTLFGMGCGRLLGGTADQLWNSLCRIAELPTDTAIYCAHEYTENNGRFALSVEPGNAALRERMKEVRARRAKQLATVPFLLREELATNPFLRADSPEIRSGLGMLQASDLAVFTRLRQLKDEF
jgi:hydroxyacylglutathione hydrolase